MTPWHPEWRGQKSLHDLPPLEKTKCHRTHQPPPTALNLLSQGWGKFRHNPNGLHKQETDHWDVSVATLPAFCGALASRSLQLYHESLTVKSETWPCSAKFVPCYLGNTRLFSRDIHHCVLNYEWYTRGQGCGERDKCWPCQVATGTCQRSRAWWPAAAAWLAFLYPSSHGEPFSPVPFPRHPGLSHWAKGTRSVSLAWFSTLKRPSY